MDTNSKVRKLCPRKVQKPKFFRKRTDVAGKYSHRENEIRHRLGSREKKENSLYLKKKHRNFFRRRRITDKMIFKIREKYALNKSVHETRENSSSLIIKDSSEKRKKKKPKIILLQSNSRT